MANKKRTSRSKPAAVPAPHLTEPKLTRLTMAGFPAYQRAVARGFQEQYRPERDELDRKVVDTKRFIGFKVGSSWVSSAGSYARKITVPGGLQVPVAAVTNVTVQPAYRRRGLLTAMMQRQLEDVAAAGEPLAALWASEALIYGRFGYGPAAARARLSGSTRALQFLPGVPTAGSCAEVPLEQFQPVAAALQAAMVTDRPGKLDRPDAWWELTLFDAEWARRGAGEQRYVLHYNASGDVDGYATYRFKEGFGSSGPDGEVHVGLLAGQDAAAYAGLWRYLLDLDLARKFVRRNAPTDELLRLLVTDARAVHTEVTDNIYVRLVDVAEALRARRYATEIDLVLEVADRQLPGNSGRYRLRGGPDDATVARTKAAPDLSLSVLELGTAYLGGVSLFDLHRAGRVAEHTAGAAAAAATAFGSPIAPWCPDEF
ncbi:GNAT family N-acetyltransferase [Nakamurella aerolata]|uniref:GNAT family N-acetyltransferase n=1 Tax=Nakamurella aerolata TaxID=1656892 RepID=A0A849A7W0_9ACTN|nr:GNAT family N-acetyltransferase [Nakamurella aerolata]NNG36107.1 GNAT family N-acetyltransferase [Nakamurella aerolata]